MEKNLEDYGFSLPPGYWENARINILDRISNMEEIRGYKSLSGLHGTNSFVTPENYFEAPTEEQSVISVLPRDASFVLPEDYSIEKDDHLPPASKVISMRRLTTWAAAALLVVSAGFWVWAAYKPASQEVDCGTLACMEEADVLKSAELENLNDDDLLQLINDEEIEKGFDASLQNGGDSSKSGDSEKKPKEKA